MREDPSPGSSGADEALNACFSDIRAVKADVPMDLERGPIGWTLDEHGIGIGRHYSDHFQDPTLCDTGETLNGWQQVSNNLDQGCR